MAPDLVNYLLNEMGTDSDQLPLMQHLLMRMWTWREPQSGSPAVLSDTSAEVVAIDDAGRTLTLADYEGVGGLRYALSNHADDAFNRLDKRQQEVAETLFRSLSERIQGGRDVRRPTRAGDVAAVAGTLLAGLVAVVDVFRAATCCFVVPPYPELIDADSVLDITHEALIRQWARLRAWTEDEAQLAETYRLLERNAELWKQGRMALWGTPSLEMGLNWRERARPTAAWAARYGGDFGLAMGFLDASAEARAAHTAELRAQRRRQLHRLRAVTAVSVAVALLSAATLGGAWWMFVKEHVAYYRNFNKRWGEPFGIGPLNAEQVAHRATSLRFVQQGFSWNLWRKTGNLHPTVRIEVVDAKDRCTANNSIGTYISEESGYSPLHECRYEFIRAADDEIVGERAYAKDASLRWGYHYLTPENDANGRIGYYLGPNGFFSQFPNSLAEVVQFTYSPTGNEICREYFDHVGHRQPGKDHAYGQKIEYDANGRPTMQTSIDASGRPMNDTDGNATMRVEYDGAGNEVREWALDKGGQGRTTCPVEAGLPQIGRGVRCLRQLGIGGVLR